QKEAVRRMVEEEEGLVTAPCGAGKTMIALGAMSQFHTRTIILVHTNDLAKQWKDRIEAQMRTADGEVPKVTICGGGKRDDTGQVVIAMFQSLAKGRWEDLHEWASQFGLCIVDEAHHVPAQTFSQVMMSMPAKVRFGLTATPDRPDGLSAILYWHLGKELYRITTQELIASGRVLAPKVRFTPTSWSPSGQMDWPKLITTMCFDDDRNDQILEMVEELVMNGRQVLVLSDRVQHCIDMAERVTNNGICAATLVGKMTKKQRAEVLKAADEREVKVIFATTVADEGLDLPGLDTVILTTPTKAMGRIQQRIGRIMRTAENKLEPLVIDLVDNSKPLYYLHRKRAKFYRNLGCTVQELH
ncbi:restriction endonuclease subunit R, partial [Candidatus Pacearchaeota archaeon]|nr:restriction endonuclease subunit R [Candidatus Pacearchaeota archaeon]